MKIKRKFIDVTRDEKETKQPTKEEPSVKLKKITKLFAELDAKLQDQKRVFEKYADKHFYDLRRYVKDKYRDNRTVMKALAEKIEGWEETMLYIYHNIKKNQFLYSHYPDDWVRDYQDIKNALKQENDS